MQESEILFVCCALVAGLSGCSSVVLAWAKHGIVMRAARVMDCVECYTRTFSDEVIAEMGELDEEDGFPGWTAELGFQFLHIDRCCACWYRIEQHLGYLVWLGVAVPGCVMLLIVLLEQRILDAAMCCGLLLWSFLGFLAFAVSKSMDPSSSERSV